MSGRFANREVCDLIISDYATQEPLLYCDYANTNSAELTSESVHAFGGWGHPKRIGFNGEKGGSLTVETQIQSFQLWKMLTGGVATVNKNLVDVKDLHTTYDITLLEDQNGFQAETVSGTNFDAYFSFPRTKGARYAVKFHLKKPSGVRFKLMDGSASVRADFVSQSDIDQDIEFVDTPLATGQETFYMMFSDVTEAVTVSITDIKIIEEACVAKREVLTAEAATGSGVCVKTSAQFVSGSPCVYAVGDDCGTSISYTVNGYGEIVSNAFTEGAKYIVYYTAYITCGSQKLNIKSTTFPKAVSISAFTYNKSENDEILPYQMRVYKAQPQASLTLQNSNTGDPVTLTMTFDLLADKANNMLDMILLPPMPADIAYVSAVAGSGKITVTWPESEYAASYRLARQAGAGTWVILDAAFTGTTYEDTNVAAGTTYKYAVRPENATGQAGVKSSDPVTVYTSRSGTFSPTSFSVNSNSDTTSTITLTYPGSGEPSFSTRINNLPSGSHTTLSIKDKSVTESGGTTTVTFKIKLTELGTLVADSYTASVTATVPESGEYGSFSKTLNGTVTILSP